MTEKFHTPMEEIEMKMDIEAVLRSLNREEREICNEIMSGVAYSTMAEMRGISCKILRNKYMKEIRRAFKQEGLGEYLNKK